MNDPHTYTLVIKGTLSSLELLAMCKAKVGADIMGAEVARTAHGETLAHVYVWDDHSRFGIALSRWLGEAPHNAPYPAGSLLFYH